MSQLPRPDFADEGERHGFCSSARMNEAPTTNPALQAWVQMVADHAQPDRVHWCVGTKSEGADLAGEMVRAGQLIELDPKCHPRSFLYRTHPGDVDPADATTYVSTHKSSDAGPTNRWMSRDEAQKRVWPLFQGAMRGRTMYVVPYVMGPLHSQFGSVGIEITDSPYIVLCLGLMTRMGRAALDRLGDTKHFVRGLHSTGDLSPKRRFVVHFPDESEVWSVGSGNAANALLSKKFHALRLASVQARADGWLAEHMSLVGLTNPDGETHYIAVAASNARDRGELANFAPALPGWKVESLGGDVCWMRPGDDGRLWAVNPDFGVFDSVTSLSSAAMQKSVDALPSDVIFTNVALRAGRRVWWEGQEGSLEEDEHIEDWRGATWTEHVAASPAAHPRATFAVARRNWGKESASFGRNQGVPISAIVFCGRHARSSPLVYEARTWRHGVYVGATLVSEADGVDKPRHDPMAMRDFCGYNMGDYFEHWLSVGRKLNRPPTMFHINWFRTSIDGGRIWPGGAENIRVFKWILERVEGTASARSTPLGYVPTEESFDLSGLDLPPERLMQLLAGNSSALLRQAGRALEFLGGFRERLPGALLTEHRSLIRRLQESLH
jgi:phosphoenolpyruvate carboxykinase (GTP)